MSDKSVYQFSVRLLNGEEISLKEYKDKVLLIVNIASGCGFTPQLENLENLRKEFEGSDFEILAFPCNDFGNQEPLEGEAISKFCHINYKAHYSIFDKVRIKGANGHPLFKFLRDKQSNGFVGSSPRWNFHKYLVNKKGEVIDYYYPFTKPDSNKIRRRIQELLEHSPAFI